MDSRVENVFNQELASYDPSERRVPFQLDERAAARDGQQHILTNPNLTPWGKRKSHEIIVID